MSQQTFEEILNDRAEMFKDLKVDHVFEPFIGTTYSTEGHKRLLFVSYDEWVYFPKNRYSSVKGKVIPPIIHEDSLYLNIRQLFRSSSYFKHINTVLSSLDLGLTGEDIAFFNFIVKPISPPIKNDKPAKAEISQDDLNKSVEVFKAVMSFCNPDLVIFCSYRDKKLIDQAFEGELDSYLQDFGINWLDDGNLDFDLKGKKDKPYWIKEKSCYERIRDRYTIGPRYANEEGEDRTDYDEIELFPHRTPLAKDEIVPNVPKELQHLAAFIKDEITMPGGFLLHRIHHVLQHVCRNILECNERFEELLEEIEKNNRYDPEFRRNHPLCQEIRPEIYEAERILVPFRKYIELRSTLPERLSNKYCGKYSTERMRVSSTIRNRITNLKTKEKIGKKNWEYVKYDEEATELKEKRFKIRTRCREDYFEWKMKEHKRQLDEQYQETKEIRTLLQKNHELLMETTDLPKKYALLEKAKGADYENLMFEIKEDSKKIVLPPKEAARLKELKEKYI